MDTGTLVTLIVVIVLTIAGICLCWDSIITIPKRILYAILGVIGSECPRCHRCYLHERDMKTCRCRGKGREDDRGIGVKCPWDPYSGSAWPPGL